MKFKRISFFAAVAGLGGLGLCGGLQAQVKVPAEFALASNLLDKSKPGFQVRVAQATTAGGTLANSVARAEAQLGGLLIDPQTSQPYPNIANVTGFEADGTYVEPALISYASGTFPGIPGSEDHSDNIALEAICYAELKTGNYTMTVNSDDGFRATIGNARDRIQELELGVFDGGRGASDSAFTFTIQKDGVYPLRLVWFQGNGGLNVDWYLAPEGAADPKISLNATGGILAYRSLTSMPAMAPTIVAVSPTPNAINVSPASAVTFVVEDQNSVLAASSIKLVRDGVDVTAQASVSKQGKRTTIRHAGARPDSLAVVEYKLSYSDNATTPNSREAVLKYTVAAYANFNLPAPLFLETFESAEEGSLPAGWRVESPIDPAGFEDLDDPSSDSYRNFVVISRDRVASIGAAGKWDANRRLNTPEQFINGQKVESLVQGKFLYGESDVRGGSQVQYAFSPEYNLTGKSNLFLVYHSIYEQNQDNIASVEYSIDSGKTWLPVVYMVDIPDIAKNADGSINAEATLTNANTDAAVYLDPATGEEVGRSYGVFVGAARSTWKDLGPYIQGRVNDDPVESKRIEKYPLPMAANQGKVSLRFMQAGTGSWYFGVDNVGIYSIVTIDPPTLAEQPQSATRLAGAVAEFKVKANGQDLAYQWQKDGTDLAGATNATLTLGAVKKSDAGSYRCVVKNSAGSVTSNAATLAILDVPQDASSLRQGLAVYLPFDGTYDDLSGNKRNATAVGAPTFDAAAKVGKGALRVSTSRSASTFNYATLGSNADLPYGQTKDFTVAFWSKVDRLDGDPSFIANKNWGSGNNTGWTIGSQTDGRIEWNYRRTGVDGLSRKDLDYSGKGNALNNGQWNHVVVVWNINGDAKTYYNGELVDTRAIGPGTGDIGDPAMSLNLGEDGTGQYTDGDWDGLLDDVAIWDRALNDTEVLTLFGFGLFGDSILAGPVTSSLAVHLKFDGNLQDASGNNRQATAVGSVSYASGKSGQAVQLRTSKASQPPVFNYVTLGSDPAVRFGESSDYSVSLWVKMNEWSDDPAFISNKDWGSGNNTGWVIATDADGRLQWNYRRSGVDGLTRKDFDSVGGLFSDLAWHHVAVVFNINGDAVTYIDGNELTVDRAAAAGRKAIGPSTGTLFDPARQLNIGQDGTGAYTDSALYDALMDDVGIWNRALSSREVAVIFSRGLNGQSLDGTGSAPVGGPTLSTKVSGNQMTISWTGEGFVLQENGNLSNAAGWSAVTGAGANSATVPIGSGTKFFRLQK